MTQDPTMQEQDIHALYAKTREATNRILADICGPGFSVFERRCASEILGGIGWEYMGIRRSMLNDITNG